MLRNFIFESEMTNLAYMDINIYVTNVLTNDHLFFLHEPPYLCTTRAAWDRCRGEKLFKPAPPAAFCENIIPCRWRIGSFYSVKGIQQRGERQQHQTLIGELYRLTLLSQSQKLAAILGR
jgi:hypothetical protein